MNIFNRFTTKKGARWFIRRGATTNLSEGFRTLSDAQKQIDHHKKLRKLIRQKGFTYQVEGDALKREIVDRKGKLAHGKILYVRLPEWR